MKLYKIIIPKDKLIPDEQVFLVLLTIFLNEINILDKYAIFTCNETKFNDRIEIEVRINQFLFIFRLLSGKLNEAWEMMNKNYFNKPFNQEYYNTLTETGKSSLKNLKRYFSKTNSINTIRNNLSFHYDAEILKQKINESSNNTFEILLEENSGNCYYKFSADIINTVMLNLKNSNNDNTAYKDLMQEINRVAKWFLDFGHDLLDQIAKKNNLSINNNEVIEIINTPLFKNIKIPYFIQKNEV